MQATLTRSTHAHDILIEQQILQLQADIRANPGKVHYRIHLAQLQMVNGQWEKALQQLQTAAQLDSKIFAMAQTYRALIQAEIHREQVFIGEREPEYLGAEAPWLQLLSEAIVARAHQQPDAADKFQLQAYEEAQAIGVAIDGTNVNWVADADSRLGPVCEAFINGNYYWIPFNQIQQLTVEKPADLRDLVWIPANIVLADASYHVGFLPSRYVFSYKQANDQLSLSTLTEWEKLSEQSWAGVGQKMFVTDQGDYPLLAIRNMTPICDVLIVQSSLPNGNRPARSNRLTPSLLDRLTDHAPERKSESMHQQGISKREYRASVLRDISWLLNTTNSASVIHFSELPDAEKSVLNFGITALSGQYLVDDDRRMVTHSITQSLLKYEPRIIPKSLQVKALPMDDTYAARNQLSLEIRGQLWAEPYPLEFLLRSHIDLEIGLVQLTDTLDSAP